MPEPTETAGPGESLANEIIERNTQLKSERATWDTLWQDEANYVMPRKSQITETKTEGVDNFTQQLYDDTAIMANMTLAAGQLNYMTPNNEIWGRFEPPKKQRDNDESKRWFAEATEIAMDYIKSSNFYVHVHECYLNRGAFGTANLMLEEGTDARPLNFKAHDTGTYSIEENAEGMIDVFFHEFELTARQAVDKYGEENVSKLIQKAYNQKGCKGRNKKFPIIYAIFPRKDSDITVGRLDAENMPFAAVTVDQKGKKVIKESGFFEFPGGVSRYLKWGSSAYGYCPTVQALPIIKQINFIEKNMDALAELAVNPRFLIPDAYEGQVDLRAAGATYVKSTDMKTGNTPKEWMTGGDYNVGIDRYERKKKSIEDAFHVDLFNALTVRDKQMTATEVLEIVAEQLVLFSPTFARVVTELLNPIMRRVFSILLRMGKFPPVPDSVLVFDAGNEAQVPDPEIVYVSKIALATKAIENRSWSQFIAVVGQMFEFDPRVIDGINFDNALEGVGENLGVPSGWLNSTKEIEEIRTIRAQQQQAADALEALNSGTESMKNLSAASPELLNKLQSLQPEIAA